MGSGPDGAAAYNAATGMVVLIPGGARDASLASATGAGGLTAAEVLRSNIATTLQQREGPAIGRGRAAYRAKRPVKARPCEIHPREVHPRRVRPRKVRPRRVRFCEVHPRKDLMP